MIETFIFQFPARRSAQRRAHVGVVGSGDLEVLLRPIADAEAIVRVRTSVRGFEDVWETVLTRFFERHAVAATYEVNDFGATPGMVALRMRQAVDAACGEEPT